MESGWNSTWPITKALSVSSYMPVIIGEARLFAGMPGQEGAGEARSGVTQSHLNLPEGL